MSADTETPRVGDVLERGKLQARDTMAEAIYSEWGPEVWLRVDIYRTARAAKHAAWSGEGIPYGYREDGGLLKDLKVRRVWMKNVGPRDGFDEWWEEANVTDVADLTEFFRVEPARG